MHIKERLRETHYTCRGCPNATLYVANFFSSRVLQLSFIAHVSLRKARLYNIEDFRDRVTVDHKRPISGLVEGRVGMAVSELNYFHFGAAATAFSKRLASL